MDFPADVATLLVVAGLLVQAQEPRRQTPPAWTVTLLLSGGIAGLNREIQVSNTGAFSAVDRRRQTTAAGRVPPEILAEIETRVSTFSPGAGGSSQCRDCFQYRLELQKSSDLVIVESDDLSVAGTQLAPLVHILTTLLNEALSK